MSIRKTIFSPIVLRVISSLLVAVYFLAASFGFFYFEGSLILKIGFFLILSFAVAEYFVLKRSLGFLLFTLYLTLYTLFNLIYSGVLAIWVIFLCTIPLVAAIVAQWKKSIRMTWKKQDSLLVILISLVLLEALVVIESFSLSPHIQAFLTVLLPLIAVDVASDYRDGSLSFLKIFRLSTVVILAVIFVLHSASRQLM